MNASQQCTGMMSGASWGLGGSSLQFDVLMLPDGTQSLCGLPFLQQQPDVLKRCTEDASGSMSALRAAVVLLPPYVHLLQL
jgi:hypothetical protein